ncbi:MULTISPECIES: hypothetical protein [Methylorubrum]|uniref:hypothetical protein n=1 Tax=Methylorubrum TaxID=2282523 RepID=UPI0020A1B87E|nr:MULTISPECIES: hypothetical protein [Methylorubrum]MCP1549647.1 hypothetical protein [Methylorubrum zatmanii]MCP1553739.1 hypothetical protein [Methylorubrum extorquens]MCP1579949.1 hypothetical protein [Methylorubrum extorquens]
MSDDIRLNPSADAWLKFMDDVVLAIRLAVQTLNTPEVRAREERRPGWFGEPLQKYRGTRLPDETAVSRAIIAMMRKTRDRQFIAAPLVEPGIPDLKRMDFNVEVDRAVEEETGNQSKPTDIQIAIHAAGIDLRIEAKKLTVESEIESQYLSRHGLLRFDNAKAPYTLGAFGCMIAYVTDRDTPAWQASIEAGLQANLPGDRLTTTLIAGEEIRTTKHVLDVDLEVSEVKGHFHVDVIHMVFEFEARPSRRVAAAKSSAAKPGKRRAAKSQAGSVERGAARRGRKAAPTSKDA